MNSKMNHTKFNTHTQKKKINQTTFGCNLHPVIYSWQRRDRDLHVDLKMSMCTHLLSETGLIVRLILNIMLFCRVQKGSLRLIIN